MRVVATKFINICREGRGQKQTQKNKKRSHQLAFASAATVRNPIVLPLDNRPLYSPPVPKPAPLFICGPTASGKTALSLEQAANLDGEVVNADAFQLYQGLETLAASPTAAEQASVPHHLFSCVSLDEKMDAARYHQLATPVITEIQSRGKTPIVVGGSGLYLKFLTHGPSPAPPGDEMIRAKLNHLSLEEIIAQLTELDPTEAAKQTKQNAQNRRHLSRALEICLVTGQPASTFRQNFAQPTPMDLRGFVLTWPRPLLAERIEKRTLLMLKNGALDEVANLPPAATTARQAIGITEIEAHLRGDLSLEETIDKIATATRRYAKRQQNWFRKEAWLTPVPCP